MIITIAKTDITYLDRCAKILSGSELGKKYFVNRDNVYIGKHLLEEGFNKNEIYIALDKEQNCVGFSWIQLRGAFHWFPFLHIVAVDENYRGKGIGTKLMEHFEYISFVEDRSHKAFLIVSDQNKLANELYRKLGYIEIGVIPELFLKGVSEILMMKNQP